MLFFNNYKKEIDEFMSNKFYNEYNELPLTNYNEQSLTSVIDILYKKILNEEFVIDKTGVKTVEIIASYVPLNPAQPFLDFKVKKTNKDYVRRELEWYMKQSLKVKDIPGQTPKIWNEVADKKGRINSNYGYLIFNNKNGNQYENVLKELKVNKESRRALMIYNRPEIWNDYNKNDMSDYICTTSVQYTIRNNKLYNIVTMRSNDFIFGTFSDFSWQCFVYQKLFKELIKTYPQLIVGETIWQVGSLHVYERHFDLLQKIHEEVMEGNNINPYL
jgi:thymidylate synthase